MTSKLDTTLLNRLEQVYTFWATLRPNSTDGEFDKFGAYFSEDCMAWLSSMREWSNPTRGREAVINDIKSKNKLFHVEQRQIVSRFLSEHGRKATIEGKARMNIMGKVLDNLYETVIAEFDDHDLISNLKVYTCRSNLVLILQGVTGRGPYSEEYLAAEWPQFSAAHEEAEATKASAGSAESCCA